MYNHLPFVNVYILHFTLNRTDDVFVSLFSLETKQPLPKLISASSSKEARQSQSKHAFFFHFFFTQSKIEANFL